MSILSQQFGSEKRWVNWRALKVNGRVTKIPYSTTGLKASSTDEATWSTYDEVKEVSDNIGIVFTADKVLMGIDVDKCLTNNIITHEQKDAIEEFIRQADTYTEVSPSGTGLHLFLSLVSPLSLEANRHPPYEVYTSGRYFTVTENIYGEAKPVRTVTPQEALELLAILGYPWKKEKETVISPSEETPSSTRIPLALPDEELLKKMFSSKNGAEIKSLYNGDASEYDNDDSRADMALCSYLAFWTGKDAAQMERLWAGSPLGNRTKTQERKDYRDRTIRTAIEGCTTVYSVTARQAETKETVKDLDLLFTLSKEKEKVYTQNTENMCRILRGHDNFAGRLHYDEFKNTYEIRSTITEKWRTVEDNDAVNIQTIIQTIFPYFGKVGKDMVYDAILKVAKENRMDSASDWIKNIVWDKKPRLDEWLSKTYGVPLDSYHKAVGSNWMKGLVKRIIQPGCKFDYVLVLEGPQGTKKSTSLAVLGGDWHVETNMSTDNKDFFMQFAGKVIVEFSEGETLNRTEVKRMKAIITTQKDRYRLPYERTTQDFPRRCVFAMTTNQEEYLKDETGNRRWLPVAVAGDANVEWLADNREQLYAEAYHRVVDLKETIYEFPIEETLAAQSSRRIHDPNAELIEDWYRNKLSFDQRKAGITTNQVYRDALYAGFNPSPIDRTHEMRIADVLKTQLKLKRLRQMVNGFSAYRWFDSDIKDTDMDTDVRSITEQVLAGKGW